MISPIPALRCVALLVGPVVLLGTGVWIHSPADETDADGLTYAEHPPLAHTGGFGEPTCHTCHFGGEVNGGNGSLAVEGLPATIQPGQSYRLEVHLSASMGRSGFMLAIRHADGRQAGRLAPGDTARVSLHTVDSTGVQYAHHTLSGTELTGPDRSAWPVRWTAPDAPGDSVLVNVAANAANDDASEFGDDVYTTTARAGVED